MRKRHTTSLFHAAVMRLTAWYVVILMTISLMFSVVVYTIARHEIDQAFDERRPGMQRILAMNPEFVNLRQERIDEGNQNLLLNLLIFNLVVLGIGGWLSYIMAHRTLRPIEDAHVAQTRFVGDAAHELRTPLSIMRAEIEVGLRNKTTTKSEYRQILESALDEVERLHTLTDRLLALSSQQQLPLELKDIRGAIRAAQSQVMPLAKQHQIVISTKDAAINAPIHEDSLTEVVYILLDNAIKYSPEGSKVVVSARATSRSVRIDVKDAGTGIAPSEQSKIFERLYRVDESRNSRTPGYGLGLALGKQLVESMGGTLTVRSALGAGSTFTICLPRHA